MKRGKPNKSKVILDITSYIQKCTYNTEEFPEHILIDCYLLNLANDLKNTKISRVTKKFLRSHPFFDSIT